MKVDPVKQASELEYQYGDIVFLITDTAQDERMVIGYDFRPSGVLYVLSLEEKTSIHYLCEISKEKDLVKKLTS